MRVRSGALSGEMLRDLGQILGAARDWDVFLARSGPKLAAAFPEERSLDQLLRAGGKKRAIAYARLADYLSGPQFRRLSIVLAAIGAGSGWQDGLDEKQRAALALPIEAFAAEVLTRRCRRVTRSGEDFKRLDHAGLHAVRLAVKRLRYAAEFFESLFAPTKAKQFVRRLTTLQDRLGHVNDALVATSLLVELGPMSGTRGFAIGVVRGFVAAEASHDRKQLERSRKRFRTLKPFWG